MKKRLLSLLAAAIVIINMAFVPSASAQSSVKIGDYIVMGQYYGQPILWRCVDIDENGPLILSDKIICMKAFDASGNNTSGSHGRGNYSPYPQHRPCTRQSDGSNFWGDSNIRCWLNSTASAGKVNWLCGNFPSSSSVGEEAYDKEAGFLTNFDSIERKAMKTVTQKTIIDPFEYEDPTGNYDREGVSGAWPISRLSGFVNNYDSFYNKTFEDTVFLLEEPQIYSIYLNRKILGNYYYKAFPTASCVKNSKRTSLSTSSYCSYWLRTAGEDRSMSRGTAVRLDSGVVNDPDLYEHGDYITSCISPKVSHGVRPAFYLNTKDVVLGGGDGRRSNPYIVDKNKVNSYSSSSTSSNTPTIKSASITYKNNIYDLFSQPISIEKGSDIETAVSANVDFNGCKNVKLYLTQGADEVVELVNGAAKTIQAGKLFSKGDIYLLAVDMDSGKSTAMKTKLNVSELKSSGSFPESGTEGLNFTLGKKIGFTIPDSVPIFGGTDINWDFGFIPLSVEYDREDNNKINVVFGTNIASEGKNGIKYFKDFNFKKYKEDVKKAYRKQGRTVKQIKNDYKMTNDKKFSLFGDNIFGGGKGSIDPSVDIAGYAECKIINGKPVFIEGQMCLEVELMFNYQGQIFIWVFPCYYEIGGGIGAGIEGNMININPDGFTPEFDAYLTAKIKAEIGGGIGVAKVATVGASGEGSLNVKTAITKNYLKSWAEGKASFNVKVLGKTVASKSFLEGSFLIYETGSNLGLIKDNAVSMKKMSGRNMFEDINIAEKYPNEDRSYAENPTVWQSGRRAMLKSAAMDFSNKNLNKLASNIYTEAKPVICDIDGTKVMVMQWDNLSRADIDRIMLIYSIYDENTGTWSEPKAVDDDGTADFYPCFKDGYLVWQNSKQLLSDDMTLQDIAKTGEICLAKWNGSGFDKTETLTENETLDTMPTVCEKDGVIEAAWISNSENDILGISGRNVIKSRKCIGDEWTDATDIKTDLNAVVSIASGYSEDKYCIAYIEDADNDLGTMNDRDIIVISEGFENNITNNNILNSNPVFADNQIYYYSDGNIIYSNIDGSNKRNVFNETKQGLTDNFVADVNSEGDRVILWTKAGQGASEVYAALYKDNEWSEEIQITSLGNMAKYPFGVLNNDGTMLIAFNSGITENSEIIQTDLYTVSVIPAYDLEVIGAYIDEETMKVHATVKNSGELPINSYIINLEDNGINNSQIVTEPLLAGSTKEIEIIYNKPADFAARKIIFKAAADNVEEYNLKNNSSEISVGLSDIAITSVNSYEILPMSFVTVTLQNKGNCDAENVVVSLRKEKADGEAAADVNAGTIPAGGAKSVTLEYEPKAHENIIWYVTARTDSQEITTADNAEYFVNNSFADLPECEHKILNYSVDNDILTINTFVRNNMENRLETTVYAAVYDGENKLAGIAFQPIAVDGYGDTGVDLWIEKYKKNAGDYIKVFMWDSNQNPKCDTIIKNIE